MSYVGTILELTQRLRAQSLTLPDLLQVPDVAIARGAFVALKGDLKLPLLVNREVGVGMECLGTFPRLPQTDASFFLSDWLGVVAKMPSPVSLFPSSITYMTDEDVPDTLADEFCSLVTQWENETLADSSLTRVFTHPAYQRIIGMGKAALPLILHELQSKSGQWFYALVNIVGFDIAEQAGATSFAEAREAWLEWGRQNAYLK